MLIDSPSRPAASVPRRLAPLLLLANCVMVTLAGAAGADDVAQLDRARLTKRVAATVATAHPDLPVTKVRCRPKQIDLRRRAVATCSVTAGGYPLVMRVTVTDKRGNVAITSTQAVIPKASAEGLVAANATLPVTADCGPAAYVVRKPGEPFPCTATFADGTQSQVTVTPTDVAGNAIITAAT